MKGAATRSGLRRLVRGAELARDHFADPPLRGISLAARVPHHRERQIGHCDRQIEDPEPTRMIDAVILGGRPIEIPPPRLARGAHH
jgi:hypothetical protein